MAKYVAANTAPLTTLQYHPYQIAFLEALKQRHCDCGYEWKITFSAPETLLCPKCKRRGQRSWNRFVLVAGRRGGKTRVGTLACALELSMPDTYGWICAPTYRDLTDFVEPAFFKQIPQKWVDEGDWSASDRILTLPNRSQVAFRSLEDPETVRGPGLDFLIMDETAKISPKAWEAANPALADKQGIAIFPTTPKGEDWVYEKLWLTAERHEPGWWACRYTTLDNPHMKRDFVEAQRRVLSDSLFRQEYEADFVTFEGAIYGDLLNPCVIDDREAAKYLLEWPKIDPSRAAIVGLDPGSDHPFAGVLAVSTPDALVLCGEYLEREKPAMVHAQGLRLMALGLTPRWAIDRSQAQMIIELAQHQIFAAAAENDVIAGIERVKSWMKSGRLKIVKSRCPRLAKELASYKWKETTNNDGSSGRQEPYKRKDDLCDALRYLLMAWPHLPAPIEITTTRDLSTLPEKVQRDIERMERRMKQESLEKVDDGTGEFYDPVEREYADTGAGMYDEMYA